MDEVKFERGEVRDLIDHLSSLADDLSPNERKLLVAIFAAAADHVKIGRDKTEGTLTAVRFKDAEKVEAAGGRAVDKLRQQLREAYVPAEPTAPIIYRITPPPPPPPES
jgi:hypothetical protein